jgi:hypothetical protein
MKYMYSASQASCSRESVSLPGPHAVTGEVEVPAKMSKTIARD